jgi:hypothetical protein
LVDLGVKHLSEIFKELGRDNIGEIWKVVSYFSRMVEEEDNAEMFREVSKEEELSVLHSFQKD